MHKAKPPAKSLEAVSARLTAAWGRDVGGLGFIRRQEGRHGDVLGSLFWNDDAVRVQTFVQHAEGGVRQLDGVPGVPVRPADAGRGEVTAPGSPEPLTKPAPRRPSAGRCGRRP